MPEICARDFPGDYHFRWRREPAWFLVAGFFLISFLLQIKICVGAEGTRYPIAALTKIVLPVQGKTGFTLMDAARTGIQFTNVLPPMRRMTNVNLMNGSGVALGDFDGDGLCDIYLCDLAGTNTLYKNLGNWKFQDVTAEAGVTCPNQTSTGAVFADLDGDGDLDLLVTSMGGPNACFINDGKGHFSNRTAEAGLLSKWGSSSMALADIDGNGTLDLYVCNYGATSIVRSGGKVTYGKNSKGETIIQGRNAKRLKIINGILHELGEPHILYLNDGKAHFTPVDWSNTFVDEQGLALSESPWDQGLSVMIRDLNEDGFPDLYVCNDTTMPDRIWLNNGHGKFHAASNAAIRKTSYFSMGVDVADLDRDSHDDIFTVDMLSRDHLKRVVQHSTMIPQPNNPAELDVRFQVRRNVLLSARGDGTFSEIANYAGVAASDWTWSCAFIDVDLDGWEDLLVTNGFEHDADDADVRAQIQRMGNLGLDESRRMMLLYPRLETPNCAFHNLRNRRFEEVGTDWGFDSKAVCNGMALADLDNDGDLDVVVNCMNSGALLYRNETIAPRIAIRLEGAKPNTRGIGARITVDGGPVEQSQVMIAGGRYVSSDDSLRVFAAGNETNVLRVRVDWPSGVHTEATNVPANSISLIHETETGAPAVLKGRMQASTLFTEERAVLDYRHEQIEIDEFSRQPSLPRKLSQTGPVIVAKDLDGDGFEDLIIGAGKGGRTTVLMNQNGKFQIQQPKMWELPAKNGDAAIVAFNETDKVVTVIQAQDNYEEIQSPSRVNVFKIENGQWNLVQTLEVPLVTVGSLALGDIDGDGDLDLFVGGRCIPGEYPRAASSFLFRNNGKIFELDAAASAGFRDIGLITGAIFSDLNGDGYPDLVTSMEWGFIHVFLNSKGIFKDSVREWNLARDPGLWTFVTTADMDGDGSLDIIAGNWGMNSLYQSRRATEVALVHGEFNEDGHEVMIEGYRTTHANPFLPFRDLTANSQALPWLASAFPTHASFGKTTVEKMIAGHSSAARTLTANYFETSIFFNRGSLFQRQSLPSAAQFSPALAGTVADFDGDGVEDLFLSQNFFAVRPEDERLDSGRGLLLHGLGGGNFSENVLTNGISIYGQQGAAVAMDFDNDGQLDLIATQNSGAAQALHNQSVAETFRVMLRGQPQNRDAIGAIIRLKQADRWGMAREIHCASGPIGQSSFAQFFPRMTAQSAIRVVWPGGAVTEYPLPEKAHSILIEQGRGLTVGK